MSFNSFRQHPIAAELSENARLQWMVIFIIVILCVSALKAFSDVNAQLEYDIKNQANLLARLEAASKLELDSELVEQKIQRTRASLDSVPSAPTVSVAEANALSKMERLGEDVLQMRSSLVGTDTLRDSSPVMWQVRVELQGQFDQQFFTSFLKKIDGTDPTIRVVSFRYRPSDRGAFSVVLDFMYKMQATQ